MTAATIMWSRFAQHRGRLIAELDVRLDDGHRTTLTATEHDGLVVIRGLSSIDGRTRQNAAAGAVRRAIHDHYATAQQPSR